MSSKKHIYQDGNLLSSVDLGDDWTFIYGDNQKIKFSGVKLDSIGDVTSGGESIEYPVTMTFQMKKFKYLDVEGVLRAANKTRSNFR